MGDYLTTDSISASRQDSIVTSPKRDAKDVADLIIRFGFHLIMQNNKQRVPGMEKMTPKELKAKLEKAEKEYKQIRAQMDSTKVASDTTYKTNLEYWENMKEAEFARLKVQEKKEKELEEQKKELLRKECKNIKLTP